MAALDVEDESILSTVFRDAFPESWRDNSEFAQYLSELSSYGVDKLNREPDRLAEERSLILEQTQDLAFHNYKTFIQTAECSKEIFQDFQIIEKHVASMLDKLPELNVQCNIFLKNAQEINNSRRMNNMTLQRHTQLLEILEMPQLMDTCVRNGYYEEALELASHVKRLEKKHSSIPVIVNIVNEVKTSTQLMLNQLVQQLRTNVQLPACLRVIGYLRRMDVFTEAELRIKFLQARDAWFQSILRSIPDDEPYYHITKTIEASRVHLFDVITQYRAIFSDEDPLLTTRDDTLNESALFHGWVVQKVSQFLHTLDADIQRGVGGRLDSLLGQAMYFGLSFSRVGADFRGLLTPIFQKAVLSGFAEAVGEATVRFDEAMQSFTLLGTPTAVPSSALTMSTQSGTMQPPLSMLEFHPVAVYCNQLLSAFNDLRLCTPVSLACDVANQIQASLHRAVEVILAYHRAEETTFNVQEKEQFGNLCRVFAEDMVPHLNRCLQVMFPPSQLAQTLGVTTSDLRILGNIGTLDIEHILSPLAHLVPVKVELESQAAIGSDGHEDVTESQSAADDSDSSSPPQTESSATQEQDDNEVEESGKNDVQTGGDVVPETKSNHEVDPELNPEPDLVDPHADPVHLPSEEKTSAASIPAESVIDHSEEDGTKDPDVMDEVDLDEDSNHPEDNS